MNLNLLLNFDMPMLQEMTEGVILLDGHGEILTHNRAADFWMQEGEAVRTALKHLVEQEAKTGALVPTRVDLCLGAFNQPKKWAKAWLCRNGPQNYAVFISPSAAPVASAGTPFADTNATSSSALLLADGLMSELRVLVNNLKEAAPENETIAVACGEIDHTLQMISNLWLLKQRDHIFLDERLNLVDVLQHLLPSLAAPPGVQYFFNPLGMPRGMVYGHGAWLNKALRVLLENLGRSAPATSKIEIGLRQLGDFIVITGHVVVGTSSFARANAVAHDEDRVSTNDKLVSPREQVIHQAICRRIIELHSGQLKLEYMPNSSTAEAQERQVESFTLTLATGLPDHERSRASCSECRYTLQAQAYAADMAQLMSPKNHANTGARHHDQSSHR